MSVVGSRCARGRASTVKAAHPHINPNGMVSSRSLQEVSISGLKLWMIFLCHGSGPLAGPGCRRQAGEARPPAGSAHTEGVSPPRWNTALGHHLISGLDFEWMFIALSLSLSF